MSSLPAVAARAVALLGLLVSLSLTVFLYERSLVPHYGSVPTHHNFDYVALASILVAILQPFKLSNAAKALYASVTFGSASKVLYWMAVWTARRKDPVYGPLLVHIAVLTPLVSAFILLSSTLHVPSPLLLALCSVASSSTTRSTWHRFHVLNDLHEDQVFSVLFLVSAIYRISQADIMSSKLGKRLSGKKKKGSFTPTQIRLALMALLSSLWWGLRPTLYSPILPHPLREPYASPRYPLIIHSSVQSTTGLISVGEALGPQGSEDDYYIHSVRYLRAAHSLLGGVWTQSRVHVLQNMPPLTDAQGQSLGDSIYGVFVLQEAARLINSTEKGLTGQWQNALTIGLGIGTSTTSFIRHGLSASIVEIDPAVYDAARTYFGLPDPGVENVFLEDARGWAAREAARADAGAPGKQYDIVVHDCFSGGGVPEHIYTVEFWSDLKKIMHPTGILVLNFVGIVKSVPSRMVLHTLEHEFWQCRAFHDSPHELDNEKYSNEILNIVFFCTTSPEPITFREADSSDYLGSPLRRHLLQSLSTREIDLSKIREGSALNEAELLLTDTHNPLGMLQEEQAYHHWKMMREVLPDIFWETF